MEIDPVGRRIVPVGELHRAHLPDDDGPQVDQALERRSRCVARWVEVVVGAVAAARSEALEVEDVFDAEAELGFFFALAGFTP